jgi:hypothetical protein
MTRNRRLSKPIPVMGTKLSITGFGIDTNGNSVIRVKPSGRRRGRGFSIQTNGNLPNIHRNIGTLRSGPVPKFITKEMSKEIMSYVGKYGTPRQLYVSGVLDGKYTWNKRKYDRVRVNKNAIYSVGQDGQVGSIIAINPPQTPFKDSYVKNLSKLEGLQGTYVKESQAGIFVNPSGKNEGAWVGMSVSKKSIPKKVYINGKKLKKNNPNYKNKRKIRFGKTS